MNHYEAAHTEDGDLWHVQLPSGEVRAMTLDQLDDAFQRGLVNESTYVFQEEANQWARLGEVAGLDADEPDWAPSQASAYDYSPPQGYAQFSASGYPSAVGPHSTAPVATDVGDYDLEFETDSIRLGKRRGGAGRWIAVAMVLGGVGFAANKMGGISALVAAAGAPPPTPVVAAEIKPVVAPPPVAVEPPPPAEAAKVAKDDTRFNDDQKKALLEADKARAEKARQIVQHRREAAPVRKSPRPSGPPVFHKGGNPHDPLNSSL
jgi:hypothetical protein